MVVIGLNRSLRGITLHYVTLFEARIFALVSRTLLPLILFLTSGMALGFFNLGPGTRMFGQIGVPSIFWGSQNLGDPQREKGYVLNYEKKRVTNLELILTHMHRTGRQRLFLEPSHSFLDKNSVNERAPFPMVYTSLVSSLRSNEQ